MEEQKRYTVRLKESHLEQGDIWSFVFESDEPVPFLAGQYVHLKLLGMETGGVHEFSIASAPGEQPTFTVHVREESLYKQFLKNMKPGDRAEIFKIKGDLVIPQPRRPIVCIAQGIGITPIKSLAQDAAKRGVPLDATIVHVARPPHLFEKELSVLPYPQHRIGRTEIDPALEKIVPEKPQALYYVIGSPEFVLNISEKLGALGVSEEDIKTDDWGY